MRESIRFVPRFPNRDSWLQNHNSWLMNVKAKQIHLKQRRP